MNAQVSLLASRIGERIAAVKVAWLDWRIARIDGRIARLDAALAALDHEPPQSEG